jgi:uncharacterized protein YaaR (DUF327 family)
MKKQRLEKYSERFDNDKSAIGNTETWGKRMVDEEESQNLKNFKKLVSDEVSPAMKEFINEKNNLKTNNMTAVEWLEEQLFELRNPTLNQIEILKQAKEMEKQQQDEFAIGFAEWILNSNLILNRITVKELLEQFKNK